MAISTKKIDGKGGISGKYIVPVIVVAVLVTAAALAVSADGDANSGGANDDVKIYQCGENVRATWESGTGKMTISGFGPMDDYRAYERPWTFILNRITSVVVTKGVTSIGNYAFCQCNSLTSVTVEEGCDLLIGNKSFSECSNLGSVTFAKNCNVAIGDYAFFNCKKLDSLTFAEGSKVISIGEFAFNGCISLISVTIPGGLTSIGDHAFEYCICLNSVTIAEGSETASVGTWAFAKCPVLNTIVIGKNVTDIAPDAFPAHVFYDGDVKITDLSKLAGGTFNFNGIEGNKIKMIKAESSPTPVPVPDNQIENPILKSVIAAIAAVIVAIGLAAIYVRRK